MSWNDWVSSLLGYDGVNVGAICGYDGSVWAKSDNFTATQEELTAIARALKLPNADQCPSFNLCGTKFMTVRLENMEIDGRKGPASVTIIGSTQCFIVGGSFDAEQKSGSLSVGGGTQKTNIAVAKIKEHLAATGY